MGMKNSVGAFARPTRSSSMVHGAKQAGTERAPCGDIRGVHISLPALRDEGPAGGRSGMSILEGGMFASKSTDGKPPSQPI